MSMQLPTTSAEGYVEPTVIQIARKELGTQETGNNDVKYGKWYGLNNNPWCAMFVSWCFNTAGLGAKIAAQTKKGFASCDAGLKWFTKNNKVIPIGQADQGDIAFFQFDADAEPDHVGIVIVNNKLLKTITCIEGNTSSGKKGSQANGDGVYKRTRSYSVVMAVVRP